MRKIIMDETPEASLGAHHRRPRIHLGGCRELASKIRKNLPKSHLKLFRNLGWNRTPFFLGNHGTFIVSRDAQVIRP